MTFNLHASEINQIIRQQDAVYSDSENIGFYIFQQIFTTNNLGMYYNTGSERRVNSISNYQFQESRNLAFYISFNKNMNFYNPSDSDINLTQHISSGSDFHSLILENNRIIIRFDDNSDGAWYTEDIRNILNQIAGIFPNSDSSLNMTIGVGKWRNGVLLTSGLRFSLSDLNFPQRYTSRNNDADISIFFSAIPSLIENNILFTRFYERTLLTKFDLSFSDASPDSEITYTIVNKPRYGLLEDKDGNLLSTFTQYDINNANVYYNHIRGDNRLCEISDSFTWLVSDINNQITNGVTNIVNVKNDLLISQLSVVNEVF